MSKLDNDRKVNKTRTVAEVQFHQNNEVAILSVIDPRDDGEAPSDSGRRGVSPNLQVALYASPVDSLKSCRLPVEPERRVFLVGKALRERLFGLELGAVPDFSKIVTSSKNTCPCLYPVQRNHSTLHGTVPNLSVNAISGSHAFLRRSKDETHTEER